jgi:hypothetical protein
MESRFAAADAWLAERGLSRADIQPLLVQPADWLNGAQAELVHGFRHQFPEVTSGEAIQKVLPIERAEGVLAGGSEKFPPHMTGGSVSVARDTHDLSSPERLFHGLALDYDGSAFSPDKPVIAMRFTVGENAAVEVPDSQLAKRVGDTAGATTGYPYPFTGTGFTASDDFTVPEYYLDGGTRMNPGAEMYRIDPDGSEYLLAILGSNNRWIKVEGYG